MKKLGNTGRLKLNLNKKGNAVFGLNTKYGFLIEKFGKEREGLEIIFLSDDLNDIFKVREENWIDSQLKYVLKKDILYRNTPKGLLKEKDYRKRYILRENREWQTVVDVKFLIPELKQVFGYWQIRTSAFGSSLPDAKKILNMIKDKTGGKLAGIKFELEAYTFENDGTVFPAFAISPQMK